MIKSKNNGILIVVSGPSGAGKGTICTELLKTNNNIWESVSMTTRNPRQGELYGKDYYFVTTDEFKSNIDSDNFLEYAIVHNNQYYGTPKNKIAHYLNSGMDVLLEIDIQGALKIKDKIKDAIFIFILPPSMKELKDRLIRRNTETNDKILERFKKAYSEINEYTKYNYVIVNDKVEVAVDKLNSIIKSEKCRVDRIEEIYLNSPEEKLHEKLVDKNLKNEKIDL